MTQLELKKILADQIRLEAEYHDFCKECLKRIYGDKSEMAIGLFTECVDSFEYNCFFHSLCSIDEAVNGKN